MIDYLFCLKEMKRQWSGIDTIEFHSLPAEDTNRVRKANIKYKTSSIKQHKRKAKRTALSQQIVTRLQKLKKNTHKQNKQTNKTKQKADEQWKLEQTTNEAPN